MELENYEGLYTADYRTVNGSPVVFLFIRNKDGTKTIKRITDFKPYCYVRDDMISTIPANINTSFKKGFVDIYGKNVTKCFVNSPYDIYNIRMPFKTAEGIYDGIYESDCLYSLRYTIDHIGEVTPTKYKVLVFDIETASQQGFARKENPIEKIISISAHDNYSGKIISWCWREDLEVKQENDVNYFSNEVDMLNSFLDYFNKMNADIVSGWNCAAFDMGYLYARLRHLGISPLRLSSMDVNEFDKYESNLTVVERQHGELEILGLVIFDGLRAYKQLHFGELVSFSLNNIAITELGEEKHPIINIDDVWRNDIEELIKYNRKDVELTVGIINKCKLISIFDHVKRFAGVRNINDCFYMSRIHDTRILRKYHNKLVFPSKPEFRERRESDKLQGAYVFSKPGLYDNVVTLDYTGLYPNIMKTFNLSVEKIDMENGILINKETGLKISFDKQGIVPSIVDDLLRLKQELKDQMKGGGSQDLRDKMFAIKVIINSVWGVAASRGFRLNDLRIANTITYIARILIKKASSIIEQEFEYDVVMNDTDSCSIVIPKGTDAIEEGKKMQQVVNNKIDEFIKEEWGIQKHSINIEFEKFAKKAFFQTKKRYAMHIIYDVDDGECDKVKVVGFSSRRSDVPQLSRDYQKQILSMLLKDEAKSDIILYTKNEIDKIIGGEYHINDLSMPVKLEHSMEEYKVQNTPKLRGIRWSNKNLNKHFREGTKFKMIYVKNSDTDVVCFDDEDDLKNANLKIDYGKMVEKCIFQKIDAIFKTLNWDNDYKMLEYYAKNKISGQQTLF